MFFQKNSGGASWLIVGLGNPGEKYENTRHNVGFQVVDELAERQNAPVQKLKFKALTNLLTISGEKVLVMKPVTYMNLSGEAVRPAADFYKIPPERILVISDDTALDPGKLRIRAKGSAGGHNGLKNIIQHLGTDQFPRVRVGVGQKPHPDYDLADWVLGKFQGEDKKVMDEAVKRAADAVTDLLFLKRKVGKRILCETSFRLLADGGDCTSGLWNFCEAALLSWAGRDFAACGRRVTLPTAARRRKVRLSPFPPGGENCARSLAPPLPGEPASLGGTGD